MRKYSIYLLSAVLLLALPAAIVAQDNEPSTYVRGFTIARAAALGIAGIGLASLIIGWRAKRRSTVNKRQGAMLALVLGIIALILSTVHLSVTAGAVFGSGSGKAGAIFALIPTLAGITFAALALRNKNKKQYHGNQ